MKNLTWLACLGLLPLLAAEARAEGNHLTVNPNVNARPGAPAGTVARAGTDEVVIRLRNSCFATNLRSVSNPLAPTSLIEAKLNIQVVEEGKDPQSYNLWVKYPAELVTKGGMTQQGVDIAPSDFGGIDGMKAALFGNTVQLKVKALKMNVLVNPDGTERHREGGSKVFADKPTFNQIVANCDGGPVYGSAGYSTYTPAYPCGDYMGKNGPLSASLHGINIAGNGSVIDIDVAFPGQTGFCGGYFSPLMLFFDEKRPAYSGKSGFQLSSAGETMWVEAGSPGYFLAMDRNGNGKIDNKAELFGDQDSDKNGFEELKALDSNHDGVIDAKDKSFAKLLLWNDKNGDGISQPEELEPFKKRATKISLKYKEQSKSYGTAAQSRQIGDFWFKDGKATKKGTVEDIWFAPLK